MKIREIILLMCLLAPVALQAQFTASDESQPFVRIGRGECKRCWQFVPSNPNGSRGEALALSLQVVREANEGEQQLEIEPDFTGVVYMANRSKGASFTLPSLKAGHYFLVVHGEGYVHSWFHFVITTSDERAKRN